MNGCIDETGEALYEGIAVFCLFIGWIRDVGDPVVVYTKTMINSFVIDLMLPKCVGNCQSVWCVCG